MPADIGDQRRSPESPDKKFECKKLPLEKITNQIRNESVSFNAFTEIDQCCSCVGVDPAPNRVIRTAIGKRW
jgi:hypothetical protein